MEFRDRFPILKHKAYLNSCSQGALADAVRDAYLTYLDDWDDKGAPWELWVEHGESARAAFAGLIGADHDEVAVTTSASAAVSSIASSFDFGGERNRVVISDFEFPTVGQIWHAQERRGAEVVHVAPAGGWIAPERFEQVVDERTALVSISHVCFRNGARLDVPAIVEIAHRHDVPVLLDSYQALGSLPLDVRDLDVDLLVCGTVKYLLGSAGLAFLYVRGELTEQLVPTTLGWFSQRDIFAMDVHHNDPAPTARRFEMGTPPVPNIYAGIAGINLVRSVGTDVIAERIGALTTLIKHEAVERGFDVATPLDPERHAAMITLRATDVHALVDKLAADDVVVSSRDDNLRIAPHAYNNADDVAQLFRSLDRNRGLVATPGTPSRSALHGASVAPGTVRSP